METKKTEVVTAITDTKNTAISFLDNIKNEQVTGIDDVGKRLDSFNTDMTGLVSVHADETSKKFDDRYSDSHNIIEQTIAQNIGDTVNLKGHEEQLKTILINGNKSISNIVSDKKYVNSIKGSIKVPYRPLLWLKGGNVVDRYGLEPIDYNPRMFDIDGTFNHKTCRGQVFEDGFWYGIGTTNLITSDTYRDINTASIYVENRALFIEKCLKIDGWNAILSHQISMSTNSKHKLSFSGNSEGAKNLHMNIQNITVNWDTLYNALDVAGVYSSHMSPINNFVVTPHQRFLCGTLYPANINISRKNDISARVQIEDNLISTPWTYRTRILTELNYRLREGFTECDEAVTYMVLDKIQMIRDSGNMHIITIKAGGNTTPRNLTALDMFNVKKLVFKETNNIMIICGGKVYLNGEMVCESTHEKFIYNNDNIINLVGYEYSPNTIIKEMILFKNDNKSWNEDLCKTISKYGFTEEMVYSGNSMYSKIVTDSNSNIPNTIPTKYREPIQYLRDQNSIVKGTIYNAVLNGKVIRVIAKVSKAWTAGSEIPDSTLVPYTIQSLKRGL